MRRLASVSSSTFGYLPGCPKLRIRLTCPIPAKGVKLDNRDTLPERSSTLLTIEDVAGRLGVSTDTVLRWGRAGAVEIIKLSPRKYRISEDGLQRFLAERTTRAQSRPALN